MTLLLLLATAAMLGFMHALEVDHMLAVTAFVSRRPAVGVAARFGARWGIGHSLAVLTAGGLLLLLGVRWPARWDAAGEAAVGVMLVALGVWAVLSARKLHLRTAAEDGDGASRGGITLVGFLHGLAGTSAVVALVPVTMMDRVGVGLGYLTAFGIGVTLAMTLFAVAAAAAMRRTAERSIVWGRRLAIGVGVAGVVTGVIWIGSSLAG